MAGEVRLGGGREAKPGLMVDEDVELEVADRPRFVSRGGIKLTNALDETGVDPLERMAMDVGASTGGFTDCLLQRGAREVISVDVGYGDLAWELREDDRVTVMERTNARHLTPEELPYRPDLIVADCSFISLRKLLPAVLGAAAERFDALVMVKPQFELGRGRVGRGGVVRDEEDRREAIAQVAAFASEECGVSVIGFAPSGLAGPKGNRETFIHLAEAGRSGGVAEIAAGLSEIAV